MTKIFAGYTEVGRKHHTTQTQTHCWDECSLNNMKEKCDERVVFVRPALML